jgi:signal transduction histidine kinase
VGIPPNMAFASSSMIAPAGRRRTTRALRDVSTRAKLSAVPDHLFLLTRAGLYVDYYARDRRKLFVPPKEFLGKNIRDILPRKVAAEFVRAFARVTPSGAPIDVVYTLPHATQVRHFEARMTAVGDDEIVMIVRDVTNQKQVVAALRRSERELRQSYRRIRQLAGRLIAAQEHERSRVARELHDDLSQKLAILSIGLNQLALDSEPVERERTSIRGLITQAAEVASTVHRLSYALHPSTVATLGVVKAVQQYCEEFAATHESTIEFSFDEIALATSPEVDLCAYRVVQEGLLNAAKHSGTTRISVRLWSDDRYLLVDVADEGRGFNVKDGERRGLGLVSMRERVEGLGGHFAVQASRGRGTRIAVKLPLSRSSRGERLRSRRHYVAAAVAQGVRAVEKHGDGHDE